MEGDTLLVGVGVAPPAVGERLGDTVGEGVAPPAVGERVLVTVTLAVGDVEREGEEPELNVEVGVA